MRQIDVRWYNSDKNNICADNVAFKDLKDFYEIIFLGGGPRRFFHNGVVLRRLGVHGLR